jgi:hypothetical protein
LSDPTKKITSIKVDTPYKIEHVSFTNADNLLTHGSKSELWDTEGNKIATLGKNLDLCMHISGHSFLLIKSFHKAGIHLHSRNMHATYLTKLYHVGIDENKITDKIKKTKENLLLSQAYLLNLHHLHRKDEKQTLLYPNMPDGRSLASLADRKILTPKFKLAKADFIPKTVPASQPTKHLLGQS